MPKEEMLGYMPYVLEVYVDNRTVYMMVESPLLQEGGHPRYHRIRFELPEGKGVSDVMAYGRMAMQSELNKCVPTGIMPVLKEEKWLDHAPQCVVEDRLSRP